MLLLIFSEDTFVSSSGSYQFYDTDMDLYLIHCAYYNIYWDSRCKLTHDDVHRSGGSNKRVINLSHHPLLSTLCRSTFTQLRALLRRYAQAFSV